MTKLQALREAYARAVVPAAGPIRQRLVEAFAAVAREDFLGPPPWLVLNHGPTWTRDAAQLYQDVLVSLAPDRGINNGQPSLHAQCLAACAPQPGESVVHVGAGSGYYTAILAVLVGRAGSVLAFETEADLAERARQQLQPWPQVRVIAGSAVDAPLPAADLIYVSAGVSDLPGGWLDALKPGGRLLLPLTPDLGWGVMLLITRLDRTRWAASVLARVAFIDCVGGRDPDAAASLAQALRTRSPDAVRSLRRHQPPDRSAWCVGRDWWLSTAEPG